MQLEVPDWGFRGQGSPLDGGAFYFLQAGAGKSLWVRDQYSPRGKLHAGQSFSVRPCLKTKGGSACHRGGPIRRADPIRLVWLTRQLFSSSLTASCAPLPKLQSVLPGESTRVFSQGQMSSYTPILQPPSKLEEEGGGGMAAGIIPLPCPGPQQQTTTRSGFRGPPCRLPELLHLNRKRL